MDYGDGKEMDSGYMDVFHVKWGICEVKDWG
jgi:hypothetical protein